MPSKSTLSHSLESQIVDEFSLLNVYAPAPSGSFVDTLATFPTATSFENIQKNRYKNVLPKEETRVKLQSATDYINANFVHGPSDLSLAKFICTQAPLKHTCSDFWKMVWEQNSQVIVMLTKLEERGQEKCVKYWSSSFEEPVVFTSGLQVKTVSEKRTGTIERRTMELSFQGTKKRVEQFQYLGWPDHGVPDNTEELSHLIRTIKTTQKQRRRQQREEEEEESAVVVHCSAGIGRTGTFVALFHFFESFEEFGRKLSVFELVKWLRTQRDGMVQTLDQYLFIYRTIKDTFHVSLSPSLVPTFNSSTAFNFPSFNQEIFSQFYTSPTGPFMISSRD